MRILPNLALVASLTLVGLGCTADATPSTGDVPQKTDTVVMPPDGLVVMEYVGEVDVLKNEWKIRPALPSESSPGLATRSWSRITGLGTPPPTISLATGPLTNGPGTINNGGFANPYPASGETCSSGQQCGYVNVTQGTTNAVPFSGGTIVLYNVTNGVTLANAEAFPLSPTSIYQGALPSSSSPSYFLKYGGGASWDTFTWGAGSSAARPWKWNLGTATGFTFNLQVWGVVNRTTYSNFASTTGFIDACTATGGTSYGSSIRAYDPASGSQAVTLEFPFSLYDSNSAAIGKPTTITSLQFWVDGALTVGGYAGIPGTSSPPTLSSTVAPAAPPYGIYPFWGNFDITLSGDLCYLASGTAPSRTAVFTWKNVPYAVDDAVTASFSVVLHENTDQIDFQFKSGMIGPGAAEVRSGIKKNAATVLCTLLTGGGGCEDNVNGLLATGSAYYTAPSTPTYHGP